MIWVVWSKKDTSGGGWGWWSPSNRNSGGGHADAIINEIFPSFSTYYPAQGIQGVICYAAASAAASRFWVSKIPWRMTVRTLNYLFPRLSSHITHVFVLCRRLCSCFPSGNKHRSRKFPKSCDRFCLLFLGGKPIVVQYGDDLLPCCDSNNNLGPEEEKSPPIGPNPGLTPHLPQFSSSTSHALVCYTIYMFLSRRKNSFLISRQV